MNKSLDSYYTESGNNEWQFKPDAILKKILRCVSSGSVLDLAVGTGRNALFLASRGFDTTGVDLSREAIKLFKERAKTCNLKVKGVIGDIAAYNINKNYKVILCNYGLNYLEKAKAIKLLEQIKLHTNIGGVNLISGFRYDDSSGFPYLFDKGELNKIYSDWQILSKNSSLKIYNKGTKQEHRHAEIYLLAKK